MLEDCGQLPAVLTLHDALPIFVSQASVAVGLLKLGVAGHSMVIGPPTPVMVGAVVSCTVIVCDALLELPQWAVAVQVRVMLEDCGQLPAVLTSANVSVGFVSQA